MAELSAFRILSDIDPDLVDVPAGRRKLDPTWVQTLAEEFRVRGQKTAIEVIADDGRYQLVFGGHRLAAAKLAHLLVKAEVKSREDFASEAEITLAEITENLARRELSVLDRAVDIGRWRSIYEASHQLNKGGRKPSAKLALGSEHDQEELSEKFALSFSEAAQLAFGLSRRDVFRASKIASIAADVRDRLALHIIADNQSELLALAAETAERQASIAALLASEPPQATTVADAIALIDRAPKQKPAAGWEQLSDKFSRLKPADQERFFELHEAAFLQWQKGRHA